MSWWEFRVIHDRNQWVHKVNKVTPSPRSIYKVLKVWQVQNDIGIVSCIEGNLVQGRAVRGFGHIKQAKV